MIAGFAGFGVAGFLKLVPGTDKLGTFKLGFITWPAAIAELPGANAWSVIFFLTLFLLGIDSAFSLVEGLVTLAEDSQVIKASRNTIVFTICAFGCLCSLIYSSDVGLTFLDKVDKYTNSIK
jgi:solute carrier family 6 GABA transporter-like protein 1